MPTSKTDVQAVIFQGIFADKKFLDAMNTNYTKEKMPYSVKKLKEWADPLGKKLDLSQLKWGEYQDILTPKEKWPGQTHPMWSKSLQEARDSLAKQRNTQALSPQDSQVPATKVDLADAAIRKCFNSNPPLPMIVNVTMKREIDADPKLHDLGIEWVEIDGTMTLKFTMVCPFEEPPQKKG